MKNGIVFFLCLFMYVTSGAQVGIGTATPDASVKPDVHFTSIVANTVNDGTLSVHLKSVTDLYLYFIDGKLMWGKQPASDLKASM